MDEQVLTVLQEDICDFRMRYDKINGNSNLNMSKNHYHRTYEIYYQLNGEKYYFIKDKTYHIKSGDIVLINSYDLHRTSAVNSDTTERILVRINENFINKIENSYGRIDLFSFFRDNSPILRLSPTASDTIKVQLFKMLTHYNIFKDKNDGLTDLYMRTLTVEILILLNQLYPSNQYKVFVHPSSMHKKISEAVIYINSNYMNDINLNSVSYKFHISKYYFARLFKVITGLTFIDYLNIIRLKESQTLLLQTNLTISRISGDVGYSDSSYFCRIFKKYYHISPAQYRKHYSNLE